MKKQNCVSLYTYKQLIFIKTLQKILKLDLIPQIISSIGRPLPKWKDENVIGLMTDELA